MSEVDALRQQIQFLEASLAVQMFLAKDREPLLRKWESALRKYAAGATDKAIAREALGICEYWDAGFGKRWMPIRRFWRRLKEWWRS